MWAHVRVLCEKSRIAPIASRKSRPIKQPKVPTGTKDTQNIMTVLSTIAGSLQRWSEGTTPLLPNRKFSHSVWTSTKSWTSCGAPFKPSKYPFNHSGPAHVLLHAESKAPTNSLSSGKTRSDLGFTFWGPFENDCINACSRFKASDPKTSPTSVSFAPVTATSAISTSWAGSACSTTSAEWVEGPAELAPTERSASVTRTCRIGFFGPSPVFFLPKPAPGFLHWGSPAQWPCSMQSKHAWRPEAFSASAALLGLRLKVLSLDLP